MITNLLTDIGNSHIKIAESRLNKICNKKIFEYEKNKLTDFFCEHLKSYINRKGNTGYCKVGVSLNNIIFKSEIKKLIYSFTNCHPFFADINIRLPIKIKYKSIPGNDRICSSSAAYLKYPNKNNILIIDFGTATTYNLIIKGSFTGGLIAPGFFTSLSSLLSKTTLPKVKRLNRIKLICNETKSAIESGAILQTVFSANEIVNSYKKLYRDLFVIITGGNAIILRKHLGFTYKTEENIVLEGINFLMNYNESGCD